MRNAIHFILVIFFLNKKMIFKPYINNIQNSIKLKRILIDSNFSMASLTNSVSNGKEVIPDDEMKQSASRNKRKASLTHVLDANDSYSSDSSDDDKSFMLLPVDIEREKRLIDDEKMIAFNDTEIKKDGYCRVVHFKEPNTSSKLLLKLFIAMQKHMMTELNQFLGFIKYYLEKSKEVTLENFDTITPELYRNYLNSIAQERSEIVRNISDLQFSDYKRGDDYYNTILQIDEQLGTKVVGNIKTMMESLQYSAEDPYYHTVLLKIFQFIFMEHYESIEAYVKMHVLTNFSDEKNVDLIMAIKTHVNNQNKTNSEIVGGLYKMLKFDTKDCQYNLNQCRKNTHDIDIKKGSFMLTGYFESFQIIEKKKLQDGKETDSDDIYNVEDYLTMHTLLAY